MPICAPCRTPHQAKDCEDTHAGRTGLARACYCQHKPSPASGTPGEPTPGPECATPEDSGAGSVGPARHTTKTEGRTPR
jgi:hypothetical protein